MNKYAKGEACWWARASTPPGGADQGGAAPPHGVGHWQLGLEFEPSRAGSARLAQTRSTNERAQLGSFNSRVQKLSSARLGEARELLASSSVKTDKNRIGAVKDAGRDGDEEGTAGVDRDGDERRHGGRQGRGRRRRDGDEERMVGVDRDGDEEGMAGGDERRRGGRQGQGRGRAAVVRDGDRW